MYVGVPISFINVIFVINILIFLLPQSVNLALIIDLSILSILNIKKLLGLISLCNIPLLCKYDIHFEQ